MAVARGAARGEDTSARTHALLRAALDSDAANMDAVHAVASAHIDLARHHARSGRVARARRQLDEALHTVGAAVRRVPPPPAPRRAFPASAGVEGVACTVPSF